MEFGPRPARARPAGRPFGSEWIGDELRPLALSSQAHLGLHVTRKAQSIQKLMISDRLASSHLLLHFRTFRTFISSVLPTQRIIILRLSLSAISLDLSRLN